MSETIKVFRPIIKVCRHVYFELRQHLENNDIELFKQVVKKRLGEHGREREFIDFHIIAIEIDGNKCNESS